MGATTCLRAIIYGGSAKQFPKLEELADGGGGGGVLL